MIVGLGIDVVEIERIRSLRQRRGDRFCERVFTAGEVAACLRREDPAPSLAARFAAKEAGMKALGTGWGEGVGWRDLEVVSVAGKQPRLQLHGRAARRAADLGARCSYLSLTHDGGVAAAVVVLEAGEKEGT